jgi:uncharacterized protein (UPF0332 family)
VRFDWREYLALAESLLQERKAFAPEEACIRSAISRAYYAALISARNRAVAKDGFLPQRERSIHQQVKDYYKVNKDRKRTAIGSWLGKLARKRNMADYNDVMIDLLKEAEESIYLAKAILTVLDSLP